MTIHEIESSNALAEAIKSGVHPFIAHRIKPMAESLAVRCGFSDTEEIWRVARKFGKIHTSKQTLINASCDDNNQRKSTEEN